jgi:hypothetical protein
VAVNSIYASIIPSYKYNLVLKSFSYGTLVMGHPVLEASRSLTRTAIYAQNSSLQGDQIDLVEILQFFM